VAAPVDDRSTFIDRATSYFKKTFRFRDSETVKAARNTILRDPTFSRVHDIIKTEGETNELDDAEPRHKQIIPDLNSDEDSEPIPIAAIADICHGRAKLSDFS